ncbi:hypothetical protein V8D89_016178 [Ganoderma adspersum]
MFPQVLASYIRRAKNTPTLFRLKTKGVYTPGARALARGLILSGCSQKKVGLVIAMVGNTLGVTVKEKMSAHLVQRCVVEGGVASDIQIGYEMSQARSFTISSDATSNRHTDYMGRHMAIRAPDYSTQTPSAADTHSESSNPQLAMPKNRLLGVESAINHTSETQVEGWKTKFQKLVDAYNKSPLAQRLKVSLTVEDCAIKLKGVGGDHAADQLKTTRLLGEWKKESTYLVLAWDELGSRHPTNPSPALQRVIAAATTDAILGAGGPESWVVLLSEEQISRYKTHLDRLTFSLGKDLHEALPPEERRSLDLFLRMGCMMHKELNSFKGGNTAMMAAWAELDTPPPILLANRENASTLRDVDTQALAVLLPTEMPLEGVTAAQLRALAASARGGAKLAGLGGAVFNHSDDKKGQQDTYIFYWTEIVDQPLRYPDCSNVRYFTHGEAACELLANHGHYLRFLVIVRDRKERPRWSHLEENVVAGLQDDPTLTELAAMAFYDQVVTQPYLRATRVLQNGLKLGPYHDKLKTHLQSIIDNLDLILGPDATAQSATLDGEDWQRPGAITAIRTMAYRMPHLRHILRAFFKGALHTWESFTKEFEKGGAIDQCTEEELDDAWIFATNDANEGALGLLRQWLRANPFGTELYYNSLQKCVQNNTEAFMRAHFTDEDHQHVRAEARVLDNSGHERVRRKAQVEQAIAVAEQRAREREERERREQEAARKVAETVLITDQAKIQGMTRAQLDEQLEVHRKRFNDAEVPMKSKIPNRPEKLEALLAAVERYRTRAAAPGLPSS